MNNNDILKRIQELDEAEKIGNAELNALYKKQDEHGTVLESIRKNSTGIATGLAFVLTASSVSYSVTADAKNPNIFDIPAVGGNGRTIQKAAAEDLKNYTTPVDVDKRLQAKVTTTSTERKAWQNLATAYAFNHKMGSIDKKDGSAQEFFDATMIYNQLHTAISNIPNYKQPSAATPQQKVGYDVAFCLQQLGYDKDAEGNIRNLDTKDCIYTNDLIIAVMDFQNTKDIKRDGIVGPETFRHFMQTLNSNHIITVDLNSNTTKQGKTIHTNTTKTVTKNQTKNGSPTNNAQAQNNNKNTTSQTSENTTNTVQNTTNTADNTILVDKDKAQMILEKYFTGRELGFIQPTISYINIQKNQSILQEIVDADKNTDPLVDKKALVLCILEKYGIQNDIHVLDEQIQAYQGVKDSIILKSLLIRKEDLQKKIELDALENEEVSISQDIIVQTSAVDMLVKKNLSKKLFNKFKKAITAIVGGEIDEKTNIQDVTWQNLMIKKILPENLDMNFDEFSSLKPENFIALFNTNKAKRN
ncbi:MAG: hypothetical protein WC010_01840 [Candidatus Absconditabacterales bacterium]